MLIPRYSIRTILIITAAAAVVFLVVAQGLQGREWAAGISIGLLALGVAVAVQAVLFALVWAFGALARAMAGPRRPPRQPSDGSVRSHRTRS